MAILWKSAEFCMLRKIAEFCSIPKAGFTVHMQVFKKAHFTEPFSAGQFFFQIFLP